MSLFLFIPIKPILNFPHNFFFFIFPPRTFNDSSINYAWGTIRINLCMVRILRERGVGGNPHKLKQKGILKAKKPFGSVKTRLLPLTRFKIFYGTMMFSRSKIMAKQIPNKKNEINEKSFHVNAIRIISLNTCKSRVWRHNSLLGLA